MAEAKSSVLLFSGNRCSYCAQARSLLKRHKVPFTELNVARNSKAFKQFTRLGGRSVPLIRIGTTNLHGYDAKKLIAALKKAQLIA